jgi:hypothetical protein
VGSCVIRLGKEARALSKEACLESFTVCSAGFIYNMGLGVCPYGLKRNIEDEQSVSPFSQHFFFCVSKSGDKSMRLLAMSVHGSLINMLM